MDDVFAQREALARRQRLLAVLGQQAQQAPIVGDTGIGQLLAKLATSYVLKEKNSAIDQGMADNRGVYGQQLGQEIQKYLQQRQGGIDEGPLPTEGPSAGMGPGAPVETQANPRAAVAAALASRFPEMQRMGALDMTQLGKQELETFGNPVTERGPNGLIAVQYGNRGTRRPVGGAQPFEKPLVVNEQIVDPGTAPGTSFKTQYKDPESIGGDLYQREDRPGGQLRKLDNAPKVSLTNVGNSIQRGQRAGMEKWAELAGKTVTELADNARQSVKLISSINQMEALHGAGVSGGPAANVETFVTNLANSAGIPVDRNKLANNETFASEATKAWAAMMQANGGARGLVKEESDKIAQSLPSLLQSSQGQAQILRVMRMKAQQDITDAQTAQKEYAAALTAEDPQLFTFGLGRAQLPNPTPQAPPPGGVGGAGPAPTVSNWPGR